MKKPRIDFRAYLDRIGMNQSEAARLLGVSARSCRRWASGEEVPQHLLIVLWLLVEHKIDPKTLPWWEG